MVRIDFIKWALAHAQKYIPGEYPLAPELIASDPWGYILGTQGELCSLALIKRKRANYAGWSEFEYFKSASRWLGRSVADCQGLVDCYVSTLNGKRKDINARMGYANSPTHSMDMQAMPSELGVAVYYSKLNRPATISHVGFICGFDIKSRPLIIEARGIDYGVVITPFSAHKWNFWSLQDDVFKE